MWINFTLKDSLVTYSQGDELKGRTQTSSVSCMAVTSVSGMSVYGHGWSVLRHHASKKGKAESHRWHWETKCPPIVPEHYPWNMNFSVGCSQSSPEVYFLFYHMQLTHLCECHLYWCIVSCFGKAQTENMPQLTQWNASINWTEVNFLLFPHSSIHLHSLQMDLEAYPIPSSVGSQPGKKQ